MESMENQVEWDILKKEEAKSVISDSIKEPR